MGQIQLIQAEQVAQSIQDRQTIMVGGFGGTGSPHTIIQAILQSNVRDITVICNDGGFPNRGVGRLIVAKKVSHLIASHVGNNPFVTEQVRHGSLQLELFPQGLLAEKIRAAGAGLQGIVLEPKWASDRAQYLESIGLSYEPALFADHALIAASSGDRAGNLRYHLSACNHNPCMAMAATHSWAEVSTFVAEGWIDPEQVHTPGVWIRGMVITGGDHVD